jgi:hypothetical protein
MIRRESDSVESRRRGMAPAKGQAGIREGGIPMNSGMAWLMSISFTSRAS